MQRCTGVRRFRTYPKLSSNLVTGTIGNKVQAMPYFVNNVVGNHTWSAAMINGLPGKKTYFFFHLFKETSNQKSNF